MFGKRKFETLYKKALQLEITIIQNEALETENQQLKAENEKLIEENTYLQGEIKKIDKHSFCLSRDCATRANTLLLEKAIIEGDLDSIRRELKEIKIEIEHLKAQLQQYGAKPCSACDGEGLLQSFICNYCSGTGMERG